VKRLSYIEEARCLKVNVGRTKMHLFVDRYYRQDATALLSLRCDFADRTSQDS